jgi:hypothetical protein
MEQSRVIGLIKMLQPHASKLQEVARFLAVFLQNDDLFGTAEIEEPKQPSVEVVSRAKDQLVFLLKFLDILEGAEDSLVKSFFPINSPKEVLSEYLLLQLNVRHSTPTHLF